MFPVLLTIGGFSVSSFGLFLALAFLYGFFLVWRLCRAWDIDEEKVLDLTLLTFLGGLLTSRFYFILEHFNIFGFDILKWFQLVRFPGFSFWGSFLGGWLSLYYFSRRFKLDFLAVADLAAVGFLGGLILSDIGCFLGGCGVGIQSKVFGVSMVGFLGKRFPVQAVEAAVFALILRTIWVKATRFHIRGKVLSWSLIYIGLVKLLSEFFRQIHMGGYLFSSILIVLGTVMFYRVEGSVIRGSKRTILSDLKAFWRGLVRLVTDSSAQKGVIDSLKKSWYNQKVALSWNLRNFGKAIRRSNVKFTPKDFKNN